MDELKPEKVEDLPKHSLWHIVVYRLGGTWFPSGAYRTKEDALATCQYLTYEDSKIVSVYLPNPTGGVR